MEMRNIFKGCIMIRIVALDLDPTPYRPPLGISEDRLGFLPLRRQYGDACRFAWLRRGLLLSHPAT